MDTKKPVHDGYFGFEDYDCPVCGTSCCDTDKSGNIINIIKKYKFCKNCGQKLDWGNT